MILPTHRICLRRMIDIEPDAFARTRVLPSSQGEAEDWRRTKRARRIEELAETREGPARASVNDAHLHRECRHSEGLGARVGERCETAVERDLALDEALDRLHAAIVLTEDELGSLVAGFNQHVIRLGHLEHAR